MASDARRTGPWRVLVVLTLVGLAGMVVAWHGDGQEVARHTVEGFAQVRLGVWLLVTLGVLELPNLRRTPSEAKLVPHRPELVAQPSEPVAAVVVDSSVGQPTPGP